MNKHELREEMNKVIGELRQELTSLSSRVDTIRDELAHWEKSVELYEKRYSLSNDRQNIQDDWTRYNGLSELEIVLKVAEEHNGNIEMKLVTKIFKHKVKNPNNAGAAAFSIISRLVKQGRAIKVRKGLYRLVNSEKSSPSESLSK
jgi:glycerol-3-phosphate cytidylyltransferase-like family protein